MANLNLSPSLPQPSSSSLLSTHQQQQQQQLQNSIRLRNSSSESSSTATSTSSDHHRIIHQNYSSQQQQQQQPCGNTKNLNSTTTAATTTTTTNEWSIDSNTELQQYRNRLRRRLRYHFMSPIDKWKIKGRFPWKLLLQIIKIILVTTQVILFGNNTATIRSVDHGMLMTLHDIFLLKWDSSLDQQSVPPNIGPYAVYTKNDIFSHIDYAIKNYENITNLALGSFGYRLDHVHSNNSHNNPDQPHQNNQLSPITICFERYANVTLSPTTSEYYIDQRIEHQCLKIKSLYPPGSMEWKTFSFEQYLLQYAPDQLHFESLIHLSIKFPLRVILLNTLAAFNIPRCYDLNLTINFNNRQHSGEIAITMALNKLLINCYGNLKAYNHETKLEQITIVINMIVLFLCSMSLILCLRTLMNSQSLRRKTNHFFNIAYKRNLDTQSSLHFIDGWILMILFNDCLLIIGTIINLLRRFNMIGPNHVNALHPFELDSLCSALLGVGLLLVWFGILRYLTFFDHYNILLVTIKRSLSRVLRFSLCVLILYGGFCFSGWIILGPYHFKFYTLARTSECLFALMNGDDVFATFAYLEPAISPFVWWFSRIYLYSYVLLFIYVVLTLFSSILMDSYDTIKGYYASRSDEQRIMRVDFTWSNDQLSKFLSAIFNDDDFDDDDGNLDTLSSYRFSLIQDDYHQQRLNDESSPNNNHNHHNCCTNCLNNHRHRSSCWQWPLQLLSNLFHRQFFRFSNDRHHHHSSSLSSTTTTDGDTEPLARSEIIN
nr:mucolipin-3-like [Dermatophagoides farinae]